MKTVMNTKLATILTVGLAFAGLLSRAAEDDPVPCAGAGEELTLTEAAPTAKQMIKKNPKLIKQK